MIFKEMSFKEMKFEKIVFEYMTLKEIRYILKFYFHFPYLFYPVDIYIKFRTSRFIY